MNQKSARWMVCTKYNAVSWWKQWIEDCLKHQVSLHDQEQNYTYKGFENSMPLLVIVKCAYELPIIRPTFISYPTNISLLQLAGTQNFLASRVNSSHWVIFSCTSFAGWVSWGPILLYFLCCSSRNSSSNQRPPKKVTSCIINFIFKWFKKKKKKERKKEMFGRKEKSGIMESTLTSPQPDYTPW